MSRQISVYRAPILTLLTDFGRTDHYVAAMKGVILSICPNAQLVDISHEIAPYQVSQAAYVLSQSWATFPIGTIHVVVVDPGVGSSRRALAASLEGHTFIAPDNGVLSMVLEQAEQRHQKIEVREITASRYFHHPVSQTFHGRDVFAPVAAHRACGTSSFRFGRKVSDYYHGIFANPTQMSGNRWRGAILHVDHFGNLITNFRADQFELRAGRFQMEANEQIVDRLIQCFDDAKPGEPAVIKGSAGFLEIVVKQASAAACLGLGIGSEIHLDSDEIAREIPITPLS